jgi:hypothetical protein
MSMVIDILKMISVLVLAILIGSRFQREIIRARSSGAPWYAPYISISGLLVLLAILLPIIVWGIRR